MKVSILSWAAAAALALGAAATQAQVLMYSFETGDSPNAKDGFVPNGPGMTFSQDTYGATDGANSLKIVTNGGGYIGGYTTSNLPTVLADPNLSAVTMDVSVSPNDTAFSGTFADLGVVLFVGNNNESEYGLQFAPATSTWGNIDITPGTTTTLNLPLIAPDPDSGTPESFSTLLSKGWFVSGVQLTISENGAGTFYVDNVRGTVPEPASFSIIGAVGALALGRRRRSC